MGRLGRGVRRAAHAALPRLSPGVREIALALAARATDGPALLPGPPPGPVLVVAPHPDDETLGAGGTLLRHVEAGHAVTVMVCTSGEATAGGRGDVGAEREDECRRACEVLGLDEPVFLRLADGALAAHHAELVAALRQHGAGAASVYLPSLLDPHRDHRAANVAVAAAGLDAETYGYEVWAAAPVDVLLDVTGVFPRKLAALRCYDVALETVDYARAAEGLAAYRSAGGGLGGAGFAEGFLRLPASEHAELLARAASSS